MPAPLSRSASLAVAYDEDLTSYVTPCASCGRAVPVRAARSRYSTSEPDAAVGPGGGYCPDHAAAAA